jgi:hypothetical protein
MKRPAKKYGRLYIVWGDEHVSMTATEAMQAEGGEKGKRSDAALNEAQEFSNSVSAMGPLSPPS